MAETIEMLELSDVEDAIEEAIRNLDELPICAQEMIRNEVEDAIEDVLHDKLMEIVEGNFSFTDEEISALKTLARFFIRNTKGE